MTRFTDKPSNFYGDLPLWHKGPNKGKLNRSEVAILYGFSIDEINKAYLNWCEIFREEGSDLTFEEYLNKLEKSGLSPYNIGNGLGQYNLSRYKDFGPYTISSCRFITAEENKLEQKYNNKLSKPNMISIEKPIFCNELNIETSSIKEMAKFIIDNELSKSKVLRYVQSGISRQLKGYRNSYLGLTFEYI